MGYFQVPLYVLDSLTKGMCRIFFGDYGFYARPEFSLFDRFFNIILPAAGESLFHVFSAVPGCQENDGYVPEANIGGEATGDLKAVFTRHHHIQKYEVRHFPFEDFPHGAAAFSGEDTVIGENTLDQISTFFRVINHEYFLLHVNTSLSPCDVRCQKIYLRKIRYMIWFRYQ